MIEKAIYSMFALIIIVSLGFAGAHALAQSEVIECNKLKAQAETYKGFFAPEWQKDMCLSHNISLVGNVTE